MLAQSQPAQPEVAQAVQLAQPADLNIPSDSVKRKKPNQSGTSGWDRQKLLIKRLAAAEAGLEAEKSASVAAASKASEAVAQAEAKVAHLTLQLNDAWKLHDEVADRAFQAEGHLNHLQRKLCPMCRLALLD